MLDFILIECMTHEAGGFSLVVSTKAFDVRSNNAKSVACNLQYVPHCCLSAPLTNLNETLVEKLGIRKIYRKIQFR